jgi:hypothetical protein
MIGLFRILIDLQIVIQFCSLLAYGHYTTQSQKNKCPKNLAVFFIKAALSLIRDCKKLEIM